MYNPLALDLQRVTQERLRHDTSQHHGGETERSAPTRHRKPLRRRAR